MTTSTSEQVFVARQPIFSAAQRVVAYELLFRAHAHSTGATFASGAQATSEVLQGSLLAIGLDALTGGKPAFVNFPREALLRELTASLPQQVVIEVLEDVAADAEVLAACRALRRQGFQIALDDYCFEPERDALLAVADIVKVDLTLVALEAPGLAERVRALRARGIRPLAEKVETQAQFTRTLELGFELFQGYFWGRPEVVKGRQIPPSARAYFNLVTLLGGHHFDVEGAKEIVKSDPALSQALLRYINCGMFRWVNRIESVHNAIVILGRDEIRRWAAMLGLITAFDGLPPELIAHAVARGRFCELLAPHVRAQRYAMDLFFAGLFSRADTMMGVPIAEALAAIPMSPASRTAVLEPESAYGPVLQCAIAYQEGEWGRYLALCAATGVPPEAGAAAYVEALAWTDQLLGAGST